jgi:hypothetical protein
MIKRVAILAFSIPTFLCAVCGIRFWPFYDYPLYSQPEESQFFEIWLRDKSGIETQIKDPKLLWPVGPNGLNQKVDQLIRLKIMEKDFDLILNFFLKRSLRYAKSKPDLYPMPESVFIKQVRPLPEEIFNENHNFKPSIKHEFPR